MNQIQKIFYEEWSDEVEKLREKGISLKDASKEAEKRILDKRKKEIRLKRRKNDKRG